MAMPEDFDAFLDTDDFAVKVTASNPDAAFTAIFDAEFTLATLGGMELQTTAPEFETKASNVADFVRGATTVEIEGVDHTYTVDRVKPDGTGWAVVVLAP